MPTDTQVEPFEQFLATVAEAPNETSKREAFVILAATGFGDSQLSTELALGAEYQVKFQRQGLLRRGAIDSFFGNLVVEFENDLRKTGAHALDQLRGYCAGAWTEDESPDRAYLAVAADGHRWQVFSPRLKDPAGPIDESNVELVLIEDWEATGADDDAESLRAFLNRLLFRKSLISPTAKNFARDFGLHSPCFMRAREIFTRKLDELNEDPQLIVQRDAWDASLQAAYGRVDTTHDLLAQHTYLATLARLLVWAALERRPLKREELDEVLGGIYFEGKMIANMVEDDFFRWHMIPSETDPAPVFVGLANQLAGYELSSIGEDILKPLYEDLVDPETRHALGEFYTPDWLAARVTERLLGSHDWEDRLPRILDPSCGSGTFLQTSIELARGSLSLTGGELLSSILSSVMGIDVHPLAVIVSRTTYLLAIQDLLEHADEPITLPVFLANALMMPRVIRQPDLFGHEVFGLDVAGRKFEVPAELVYSGSPYDACVEEVISVARSYGREGTNLEDAPGSLAASLGDRFKEYDPDNKLAPVLGEMAKYIAELIRERRNSVHGFMLKNHYRPAMLRKTFDFVVGNPPWLTVGDVEVASYKEVVVERALASKITARGVGEQSHTELATLFLVVALEDYLAESKASSQARIGLVMPRSVFTAKHHRFLREGKHKTPLDVVELWDLDGVTPLFNVPSCVLFAASRKPHPEEAIDGREVSGRLPAKDAPIEVSESKLETQEVEYRLGYLGRRSAWRKSDGEEGASSQAGGKAAQQPYSSVFRQGAILYPQMLLVVTGRNGLDRSKRREPVKTDPHVIERAKKKTGVVNHIVDTSCLFCTVAADHLVPFAIHGEPWTVLLPVLGDPGTGKFTPVGADRLRAEGLVKTADWLQWAEVEWESVRKENETEPLHSRLDYVGQLSSQDGRQPHVVVYTAAGKRPVASVLPMSDLRVPFVARDRTYHASFSTEEEAHFLVAMLNSDFVATSIADWINRGLFGPRDINKRALDVPWPKFNPDDEQHARIAELGRQLASEALALLADCPELGVGKLRTWLRSRLDSDAREELEALVRDVSAAQAG